jgi:hypothetical protein
MKATMDSIFTIAFGLDLNTLDGTNDEGSRFAAAFDDASEFTLVRYVNVFWKVARFLNVGVEATLRLRIKAVDEFIYKRVHARAGEMSDDKAHDAVISNLFHDLLHFLQGLLVHAYVLH